MRNQNVLSRLLCASALAFLAAGAVGCGAAVEGAEEESVMSEESPLIATSGANYVGYSYYSTLCATGSSQCVYGPWMKCANNQVAVGLHKANQKLVCVTLPAGNVPGNATLQVPGASSQILGMQACPAGQYIQGIATSGNSSWLYCRQFSGIGWSSWNATSDSGTASTSQSGPVYSLYPNAHVCPATALGGGYYNAKAMVGVHLSNNVFACAL